MRLTVLLLLVAVGCASDQRRVADAATSHYWHEARYERECVVVVGPPSCEKDFRPALQELKWQAQTSAAALSKGKGKLPTLARKRLKAAKDAMERIQ